MLEEPSQLLVIDDEPGICDVLTIGLEREGYAVTVAHDGKKALAHARGKRFDLILLDLKLPDMNGLELLAQLRESHSALDVPIIIISGTGESADIVAARQKGANDYLTKPFDMTVVRARIRTLLSLKQPKDTDD